MLGDVNAPCLCGASFAEKRSYTACHQHASAQTPCTDASAAMPCINIVYMYCVLLPLQKETHSLFPAWFKASIRAFLLSHLKQHRALVAGNLDDDAACLAELPTELVS